MTFGPSQPAAGPRRTSDHRRPASADGGIAATRAQDQRRATLSGASPMAATVHSLFVPATPAAAPAVAAAGAAADDALRRALCAGCVEFLGDLARQMLDSADDALFKMSETAASDLERRQFIDTMRVLRLDRAGFGERFSEAIAAGFEAATPSAADTDPIELRIQPTEELEERIAIANLAARIDGQFGAPLQDLRRRLDAARANGARIPEPALTPSGICAAFAAAMTALRAGFEIKLIVYKLFERVLCRNFERLLRRVLDTLEQHGYSARVAAAALPRHGGWAAAAATQPAAAISAATPATAAAGGMALPWPAAGALPDSTRALIAALLARLSAASPSAAVAATAAPAAKPSLPPVVAELLAMAEEFDGDHQAIGRLDTVLASALASARTGGDALHEVVASLRAQLREQRRLLLRQVRGEVARELELRIIDRALPTPLHSLLRSGIGPLLALRLLHGGRDSDGFRDADRLLDRVLASLDIARPPREQDQQARAALLVDLRMALLGVGMSAARAGLLIDGLLASWAQCDAMPPTVTAASAPVAAPAPATETAAAPERDGALHPAAPALLARVLLPETWFRVFDVSRNQTRWLKVGSYYPGEDLVRFTGIDDSTQLSLRASRLGHDLVDGRSEPINPSPDSRAALDALRGGAAGATPSR